MRTLEYNYDEMDNHFCSVTRHMSNDGHSWLIAKKYAKRSLILKYGLENAKLYLEKRYESKR